MEVIAFFVEESTDVFSSQEFSINRSSKNPKDFDYEGEQSPKERNNIKDVLSISFVLKLLIGHEIIVAVERVCSFIFVGKSVVM